MIRPFAIVKVLIVNEKGELLTLRRNPNDVNRPGQWDFPGGNVEAGEELLAAARRETEEECGITPAGLQLVYGTSAVNPKGSITWLFFLCRVTGRPAVRLSHEHVEYKWQSISDFLAVSVYDLHKQMLGYLTEHELLGTA